MSRSALLLALLALAAPAAAQNPQAPPPPQPGQPPPVQYDYEPSAPPDAPDLPRAEPNDQRRTAGRMVDGELHVELEVVEALWMPRGADGPRIVTPAFAEAGGPPQVPGPLIRAPAGTPVRVTVHNRLPRLVLVRGLVDRENMTVAERPATIAAWVPDVLFSDSVPVLPGETREARFTSGRQLSSFYYARVLPSGGTFEPRAALPGGSPSEGALVGGLVFDPAGQAPPAGERLMVLTRWGSADEPGSRDQVHKLFVNGLSWPHTERMEHAVGDTVRWRLINTSVVPHPMHLHGFYFTVHGRGNGDRDTVYAPADRPRVVTDLLGELSAVRVSWVPEEPGNWLFHCHLLRHSGPLQRFSAEGPPPDAAHDHAMQHMAGLVTGITVSPPRRWRARDPRPARTIHLWTGQQAGAFGDRPALGFVAQEGAGPPAADSVLVPGSPLVLHRGVPTEIVVHNRFGFPLSVHWHGQELRSLYDGVGHWSGVPGSVRPPIAPGGSATVVLNPRRAGTFMYHVHGEQGFELAQGLYGPLIVLDPGETWDAERDRMFVLAGHGPQLDPPPAINGRPRDYPVERFEPGRAYRLRFMHISPDEYKEVRIRKLPPPPPPDAAPPPAQRAPAAGGPPPRPQIQLDVWRPLAKDGAALPAHQSVPGPSRHRIGVGETYDVEWVPSEPGIYVLEVVTQFYPTAPRPGILQRVALGVGDVPEEELLNAVRVPPPPRPQP